MSDFTEVIYPAIQRAAKRVALSWPENIDAEDLAQDMAVRVLEAPGVATRIMEEDEKTRASFLIKMGHQVASQEQIDFDRFSGNYLYDAESVRKMLDNGDLTNTTRTKFDAEILDLQEGLANLADSGSTYYAEIVNRWVHEITPHWQDKTAHSRITRAVEALTQKMNLVGAERKRSYNGPGNRSVMSNLAAQGLTVYQNEEGYEIAYPNRAP